MFEKRIENLFALKSQEEKVIKVASLIQQAFLAGNKVLLCGNGGSASDSNHIAAELVSKFQKERKSLPAISLASNNSILTAIANDYSFDDVFKRQIEGLGVCGDVLIALSTSGKSKNVLKALEQAKKQGLKTVFLTGEEKSSFEADIEINAPSFVTCEIQEMHIAIGHVICEIVEKLVSL